MIALGAFALAASACGGMALEPPTPPGVSMAAPPAQIPGDQLGRVPVSVAAGAAAVAADPSGATVPKRGPALAHAPIDGVTLRAMPGELEMCKGGALTIASERVLDALDGDFTLEMWLRLGSVHPQTLISAGAIVVGVSDGRLIARTEGGATARGATVVAGEWYHVALVVEGRQFQLYENGAPGEVADFQRRARATAPLKIQSAVRTCTRLDNVRFTPSALYRAGFLPQQTFHPLDDMLFGSSFDGLHAGDRIADRIDARLVGNAALVAGKI